MSDNGYPTDVDEVEIKKFVQGPDSASAAFGESGGTSALSVLMEQAKEFIDNTFRYDIPNTRVALGIAMSMQRLEEHGYVEGILFWKYTLGLTASRRAQRANLFVDAVIGERKWKEGERTNGFFKKTQDFMFGKKE